METRAPRSAAPFVAVFVLAASRLAWGGALEVSVGDAKGDPVEDAVVVAVPLAAVPTAKVEKPREVIDQIGKEFVPVVKVIQVGTAVSFPNKDKIRHHVYSFSTARKFELPLYRGVPAEPIVFDKPGLVVLGCNIHDWMIAYVYVVDSPFFTKTEKDGAARIANLPPGEYDVQAFHPRAKDAAEPQTQRVTIGAADPARLSFRLTLKPPLRSARPPREGTEHYP
jgi:plastocyanin